MIHIYLRTTNDHKKINQGRPKWFGYEKCFTNLLSTIQGKAALLNVVFDGNMDGHFIHKYQQKYRFNLINIEEGSDIKSNSRTFELIEDDAEVRQDDLIYVLEDDYVHRHSWVPAVENLMTKLIHPPLIYISLYDHPDKYLFTLDRTDEWGMYRDLKSTIIFSDYCHWRFVPSTCGSFIFSKSLFDRDYEIHHSAQGDHCRFLEIAKTRNQDDLIITPMPSLSTHSQLPFVSPIVDWEKIIESSYHAIKL